MRQKYYVSGIIQIEVYADSAPMAAALASVRAGKLETGRRISILLDNIAPAGGGPTVALSDAAELDADPEED